MREGSRGSRRHRSTLFLSGNAGVLPMTHVTTASAKMRAPVSAGSPQPATLDGGRPSSPAGMAGAFVALGPRRARQLPAKDGDGATVATNDATSEDRAGNIEAAFDVYAKDDDVMAADRVVLAVADLGIFDACDCELAGRALAKEVGPTRGRGGNTAVSLQRFAAVVDALTIARDEGRLGSPESGVMELAAPEFLSSDSLRALFDRFASARGDHGGMRLLDARGWLKMLDDCGLIDDDSDGSSWRGGMMSAHAANVIFARARGASLECDDALHFAPDFVAALAWVAATRGSSFGYVAGKVLALAPPPPKPVLAAATDSGASRGHRDDPDEAFKYELFDEHDDLESTGLSTPTDPARLSAAAMAGAPPREQAAEALREAFRCLDLAHRGSVPGAALVPLLGAAGAFNHLDLNAAAVFMQARLARLCKDPDEEITLPECGKHLRALLRTDPPESVIRRGGPITAPVPVQAEVSPEDSASCQRVFERFCAAGRESGFGTEPHPMLMDLPRWEAFVRKASLFDVDLTQGAERVAFARACPSGNLRLGFSEFMRGVGYVAAQKQMSAQSAAAAVKRTKLSIGPPQVMTPKAPGRVSSVSAGSIGGLVSGASSALPGGRFARPRMGAPAVADPEAAEAVIAAAAPVTAAKLPLVLADMGALESLEPNAAGNAIAGARIAFDVEHDGARVGRDDIVRLAEILDQLRREDGRVDPRPPPRALKVYEDHVNLRKIFFDYCLHGLSPAAATVYAKRLKVTWQQTLVDADVWACRERFEHYGGPKGQKVDKDLLNGLSQPEIKPEELFAPLVVTDTGPGSRTVGFMKAYANRPAAVAKKTARAFGQPSPPRVRALPRISAPIGSEPNGGDRGRVSFASPVPRVSTGGTPRGGVDGDGHDTVSMAAAAGAVARFAAAKKRAASIGGGGANDAHSRRLARMSAPANASAASEARAEDAQAAVDELARRLLPDSQRVGISRLNWRKLCGESGLLCDAFTPVAVDIAFARCRAPGSDVMSWGEFLRAVGYVADRMEVKYGTVVNAILATIKPRQSKMTPRQAAAAASEAGGGARMSIAASTASMSMMSGNGSVFSMPSYGGGASSQSTLAHPRLSSHNTVVTGVTGVTSASLATTARTYRSGSHMPTVPQFLAGCERSHQNVVARLSQETIEDRVMRERAQLEKHVQVHHENRAALELATRRMNGKDSWNFLKDLKALKEVGLGEAAVKNPVQEAETNEERARRLGIKWLSKTVLKNKVAALPQGVTLKEAASLIKSDAMAPYVPAGSIVSEAQKMKVGVLTQGAVGSRFTVGGLPIASTAVDPSKSLSRHQPVHEDIALPVPAMTLPTLKQTPLHKRRVDPMAKLVRSMKEAPDGHQ